MKSNVHQVPEKMDRFNSNRKTLILHNKSAKSTEKTIGFLDLPGEVRNIIYDLALTTDRRIAIKGPPAHPSKQEPPKKNNASKVKHSDLARARKQFIENHGRTLGVEEKPKPKPIETISPLNFLALLLVNKQVSA